MSRKPPTTEELLKARRYDPNHRPQPEITTLRIGGKKIGTLQNLIVFSGKQKNGKSRYVSATIASAITRQPIFEIHAKTPEDRPRVALFDTEQSDTDFYRQIEQIKSFAGIDYFPPTFDAFNTREDDPADIIKMIDCYLKSNPDCSICFIDGILDLLISYNDERESKRLTNYIKKATKQYNCLMVGVIHRGKGNDLTIGHLGSMVDRMAQSILKVEKIKERNTYQLSPEWLRSDEDFTPIEIFYNAGTWEQTFHIPEENGSAKVKPLQARPDEYDKGAHMAKVATAFSVNDCQQYEELVQNIKEAWGVGRNWAVDCLKHWRDTEMIFKTRDGYTTKKQQQIKFQ